MADLYLLFSHQITERQIKEAREFGINEIYHLPDNIKAIWSQIPPDLPDIIAFIEPVKEWIASVAKEGDYIIIQGDFGAAYHMVGWAFSKGLIPLYATTTRKVIKTREGEKISTKRVFEHVRFRHYV